MNPILKGVLLMSMLVFNPALAKSNPRDEAAIKTIIESVGTLADTANFESLEKLYADEVWVDYSSLTGQRAEIKSHQALMTEWASVLPGFDRTRHAITDILVQLDGSQARATARVTADHFIQDMYWQVKGDYAYELRKNGDKWEISSHTFNLREESGTREVFGPAAANASNQPAGYLKRQKTRQAVLDFLTSLEDKDMQKFASVWADDAVQDMPYSPPGHPKRVVGKQNLLKLYAQWPASSGKADFTSRLIFYPLQDPETIFVEYQGLVEVIATGREYRQSYGGLFHVEGGKIKLFREYYDPAPFAWAFGLKED